MKRSFFEMDQSDDADDNQPLIKRTRFNHSNDKIIGPFKYVEDDNSLEIENISEQYLIVVSLKYSHIEYDDTFLKVFKDRLFQNIYFSDKNSFFFSLDYGEDLTNRAYISIFSEKKQSLERLSKHLNGILLTYENNKKEHSTHSFTY